MHVVVFRRKVGVNRSRRGHMRFNYLIGFLFLIALPAMAQNAASQSDALVPGSNAGLGASPFPSAAMPDVRVHTMNWQSAGGMYSEATGTKLRQGKYYIFYDRNPRFDWPGLDTESMKRGTTIYCELPISAALGKNLEVVWNGMLRQARPEAPGVKGSGAIYVISATGTKPITAVLKNFTGPKTKGFYAVVDAMGQTCLDKDAASLSALGKQVDALAAQLK